MKTLIFEREDIAKVLDMKKAIDLCEKAYILQSEGKIFYPPRVWIKPPYRGILGCAFVYDPGFFIERLHTRWVNNIYIVDYSKKIFVLMDASIVSELRTGAAAAVSARHLARKDSKRVGIIGSSIVARNALWALCEDLRIEVAKVYSLTKHNRERYANEMSEKLGIEVSAVLSAAEAVKDADVIVTATTAKQPVLLDDDIPQGTHICSLGKPEEIDPNIFLRARVFTEFLEQSKREGKLSNAIKVGVVDKDAIFPDIGDVILGRKPGRVSPEEVTFFDCQGLTAQDAISAWEVYTELHKKGEGKIIDLDFDGGLPSGIHLSARARTRR